MREASRIQSRFQRIRLTFLSPLISWLRCVCLWCACFNFRIVSCLNPCNNAACVLNCTLRMPLQLPSVHQSISLTFGESLWVQIERAMTVSSAWRGPGLSSWPLADTLPYARSAGTPRQRCEDLRYASQISKVRYAFTHSIIHPPHFSRSALSATVLSLQLLICVDPSLQAELWAIMNGDWASLSVLYCVEGLQIKKSLWTDNIDEPTNLQWNE